MWKLLQVVRQSDAENKQSLAVFGTQNDFQKT